MINETEHKEAVKKLESMGDDPNMDAVAFEKLLSEIVTYDIDNYPIGKPSMSEIEKLKNEYRKGGGKL